MEEEIWKDIEGYIGFYQVSNLGRVKSLERKVTSRNGLMKVRERILKQVIETKGYYASSLSKLGRHRLISTHRLVAIAFLDNANSLLEVNHKNGIKTDNNVDNLEWTTRSRNMVHAFKTGLASKLGSKNQNSLLTEGDVTWIKEMLRNGVKDRAVGDVFNVSKDVIRQIRRGKNWLHVK